MNQLIPAIAAAIATSSVEVNNAAFVVVVPKGSEDAARRQVSALGITTQVW